MSSLLRSGAARLVQRHALKNCNMISRSLRHELQTGLRSRIALPGGFRSLSSTARVAVVDGNTACTDVAYTMSELALIFPITPSSSMAELCDEWSVEGRENFLGETVRVTEMQSEAGVAGALHGALVAGGMATTMTSSQGLLLLIPNMYKIAGELHPCVVHVAARSVTGQGLCIFGDHSDVMAARTTGFAFLCSSSVQECHDMALVSHIATLKSRVPFIHFFDGMRTSHEIKKIEMVALDEMKKMLPQADIEEHRQRAVSPINPHISSTVQGPDVLMQLNERANVFFDKAPNHVQEAMEQVAKVTGRHYKLFDYHGDPDAEDVVIIMGSGAVTANKTVDYLREAEGRKVGCVQVRLFRPWSAEHLLNVLPKCCKRVAVLERCKESGSYAEPLFLDVAATIQSTGRQIKCVGGRYGNGSKEFTPGMVRATFDNLVSEDPKPRFTLGIKDDVTHLSLPMTEEIDIVPKEVKQCLFWGMGGDGTVGANKSAIKMIGDIPDMNAQGYFEYSAHKSLGLTKSNLRFGKGDTDFPYAVTHVDYEACHTPAYASKYPLATNLKQGGIFVLNTPAKSARELNKTLSPQLKRNLADKQAQLYVIDAVQVAQDAGMGKFINQIMQTVFFKLSGVLPEKQAISTLKQSIRDMYSKRSPELVEPNIKAVDMALKRGVLKKIDIPKVWLKEDPSVPKFDTGNQFFDEMMGPAMQMRGNDIPVSAVPLGGKFPAGTAKYEKRGVAVNVPTWDADACTQCNYCAFVCPHAVIRPFLLSPEEAEKKPNMEMRRAKGQGDIGAYQYRIQVSPLDCTGCEVCVHTCPDDALKMVPMAPLREEEEQNWNDLIALPERGDLMDKFTVKGSQFQKPMMEFSGACAGCGETPYVKLVTQLFGERMMIANATGCSSVWGGTVNVNPYTCNDRGHGPGWANSLFEDNAEFGLGMHQANAQKRVQLVSVVENALSNGDELPPKLQPMLKKWLDVRDDSEECQKLWLRMEPELKQAEAKGPLKRMKELMNVFPKVSQWIIGGDGWAYDIGYGGLDHVIAQGENVNILVLDNELYANTGGQASKASPTGSSGKFSLGGKHHQKKDLGMMAMAYNNVYVASICLANMQQAIQCLKDAEAYDGPSLILAYTPCEMQGVKPSLAYMVDECRTAISTGYWPLYHFDPQLKEKGENPFQLDQKRLKDEVREFLKRDARYTVVERENPEYAKELQAKLKKQIEVRHELYKNMARGYDSAPDQADDVLVLFGSETGNAEMVATNLQKEFQMRGLRAGCMAADDAELDQIVGTPVIVPVISTCGQGEFPQNSREFWKMLKQDHPNDLLKDKKFSVFGLGDSTYYFYNEAAVLINKRLKELGGECLTDMGFGDDVAEEGYEEGLEEWSANLWKKMNTPEPVEEDMGALVMFNYTDTQALDYVPEGTRVQTVIRNDSLTPNAGADRNFLDLVFDSDLKYQVGDALDIFPVNNSERVGETLDLLGLDGKRSVSLKTQLKRPFPEEVTVNDLFTKHLDVLGKPTKRFYKQLSRFATVESERNELLAMSRGEGAYQEFMGLGLTYADVFDRFPSARPASDFLVEMVPNIKPRAYSIASAPEMNGSDINLCVLLNNWETTDGRMRKGLCCDMLEGLEPGSTVNGRVRPASMDIPTDPKIPMVMAGMGSGLAPFMSFVRRRAAQKASGKEVGPMALYFGNRHEETEFLYRDELESYESDGLITLRTAFSRDQEEKVYVQDYMEQDSELMADLLYDQGGFMYVCGSRNLPKPVQNSLRRAFRKRCHGDEDKAEGHIVDMYKSGRFNVESW